ncbi:hypothetical protein F4814DRAFT_32337 [Daldinia grandis]|nr:hypothetical protein F4814DRAFT_32337 [Daldinia grandis]
MSRHVGIRIKDKMYYDSRRGNICILEYHPSALGKRRRMVEGTGLVKCVMVDYIYTYIYIPIYVFMLIWEFAVCSLERGSVWWFGVCVGGISNNWMCERLY